MAVAQQELVPNYTLRMTECAGKYMIEELGYQRQRGALDSVEGFQIVWNTLLPSVRGVEGVVLPMANDGRLVVDGWYGPQTAAGLVNFIKGVPTRPSDMPVWFAQNQGEVAAMCTPAPSPDPVPDMPTSAPVVTVPDQVALEPPAVVVEPPPPALPAGVPPPPPPAAYVQPAQTGPVIEAQYPAAQAPIEVLPIDDAVIETPSPQAIKDDLSQGPVTVVPPDAPALTPELPVVRIIGQRSPADVPIYAVAFGLLAVGGIGAYWFFGRKKK